MKYIIFLYKRNIKNTQHGCIIYTIKTIIMQSNTERGSRARSKGPDPPGNVSSCGRCCLNPLILTHSPSLLKLEKIHSSWPM